MPSTDTLLVFTAAALLLNVSPGPSNFYVMSRSLSQGVGAGVISASGLAAGSMVHVIAATLGLSAIILASATLFTILKYAGAAYLVWLGIQCFRNAGGTQKTEVVGAAPKSSKAIFLESVMVEILNPKTALFFLALLPQFVDPAAGSVTTQFLILGLIITLSGLPCDALIAVTAGGLARVLKEGSEFRRMLDWVSGSVLIAVGAFVAIADDN